VRLPAGYDSRPASPDDLEAVLALLSDHDVAVDGRSEPMREQLTWFWSLRAVDLSRDTLIVLFDGSAAAYADTLWDPAAGGPLAATARVHPSHAGRGLGTALAGWTEERAAERGAAGLRHEVPSADTAGARLFRSRGYVPVRTFWTMGRTLGEDIAAAEPPDGVAIRPFRPGDERVLYQVHERSFADHWGNRPSTYESFSDMWFDAGEFDPSLVLLAVAGERAIAHCATLVNDIGGHVYSLGVVPEARGRGIAQSLLLRTFSMLAERGESDVTLSVDATNPTGAVALYRKVGMDVGREFRQWDLGTEEAAASSVLQMSAPD
jgi:mycothiol synthase